MQSIKDANVMKRVQSRIIEKFTCDECGEDVERTEYTIPFGPRKGEKIIGDFKCKCTDKKLAKERTVDVNLKQASENRARNLSRYFNNYSLINNSLTDATFETYHPANADQQNAKRVAMDYTDSFNGKGNLLFSGTYGTGKSHLSVSITKKLMEKGKTCVFISFPKLLTKIKDTYNNDGPTEDQIMGVMKQVDLLVIDDIGAEQKTQWTTAKLFEIIDDRAGKATIYTTNLNSKELKDWVGERNFSRVMENTEPIKLNGNDYRRKQF